MKQPLVFIDILSSEAKQITATVTAQHSMEQMI
jgi:hypothetical protein